MVTASGVCDVWAARYFVRREMFVAAADSFGSRGNVMSELIMPPEHRYSERPLSMYLKRPSVGIN